MATWTKFYINTDKKQAVVEKLANLTDNLVITTETDFPHEIGNYQLLTTDLTPTYIAIGKTQHDWITIVHNSLDKMEDWGIFFSSHFSCKLIITIAQSVSSSYYFALYENGTKRREIETCYSTDFDTINFGDRFGFENPQPGNIVNYDGEESYLFDFDSIDEYCAQFSLAIQTDYNHLKWTVLKGKNLRKEVSEYVEKHLETKPWWKFW